MRPLATISIALMSAAASVAACGKSGNQSPAAAIDEGVCTRATRKREKSRQRLFTSEPSQLRASPSSVRRG